MIKKIVKKIIIKLRTKKRSYKSYGGNAFVHYKTNISSPENIVIGKNVHIGEGVLLDGAGGIVIGDGVIFAPDVKVYSRTHNFHADLQAIPFDNVMIVSEIVIERYVWIGANVIILPGVRIGEGAVVGAGSVVTRDVPPCVVIAGNPAKIVGERDRNVFERLAASDSNFVYTKFGHKKINKAKSDL